MCCTSDEPRNSTAISDQSLLADMSNGWTIPGGCATKSMQAVKNGRGQTSHVAFRMKNFRNKFAYFLAEACLSAKYHMGGIMYVQSIVLLDDFLFS